jgi:prepilin signal peptidase PulO-like enzyme (type II secretory pathway)
VFIFDLRWYLVPVSILRWGGLILIILGFFSTSLTFGSYLFALLISILITSAFFGVQYLITKGRGLGEGDIWLGAFLGAAFYNLAHLGVAILSAYFIGSIAGLFLIVINFLKCRA